MITWNVITPKASPFAAILDSVRRLTEKSTNAAIRPIADAVIAKVESETNIRRGLMPRWVIVRDGLIIAQDQALALSVFQPVQRGDSVLANARVGRGVETYQNARTTRAGVAIFRNGRPIYGPSAARLFEDAAALMPDEIRAIALERLRRE